MTGKSMTQTPFVSYDVVAVDIDTQRVRIMARGKTSRNAEAMVEMAVARRGVAEEFFAAVVAGTYQDGDTWIGGAS